MVEGVRLSRDHHFIFPKQSKPTTTPHTRHNWHWGKLQVCFNRLHLTYCQFHFHKKKNCRSFFSYQICKYLNFSAIPKPLAKPAHNGHGVWRGWGAAAAVGVVGLDSTAKPLCRLFFALSLLKPYFCWWSRSALFFPSRISGLVGFSIFPLHWILVVLLHVVAFCGKLLIDPFSHASGRGLFIGMVSVMWPPLVSCLSMLYKIGTVKRSHVGISEPIKFRCGFSWGWQVLSA